MVALSGRGWRLAPSLAVMVREADRLAPNRSRRSDGSLGDWSHRLRRSHHNPSGGYVDALDLTNDPAHGFDAHARARQIANRRDPRIEQIISNRQQWRPGRGWYRYLGINGHTSHVHFGVKRSSAGRSSTAAWWAGTPAPVLGRPPTPPPPPIGDGLVIRILWFNGEPSAAGNQPDVAAAYRVLYARTDFGKEVPVEAYWIPDVAELGRFKKLGLREDTGDHPIASSRETVRFNGGPFRNVA